MTLKIISAEKILFEGEASSVTLPGENGRFTVLPRHASIVSTLTAGTIRYKFDGAEHDVEVYFEASPRWALNEPYQECMSEVVRDGGLVMLKSGSKAQNILAKSGDDLRIDWGYFYLAASEADTEVAIGNTDMLKRAFVDGRFFQTKEVE